MASSTLLAIVGDVHGRFRRVHEWIDALEQARGMPVDRVLAVGDVEAFRNPEDHRRKVVKRGLPAEFATYADGERTFPRPMDFIAGNNEDFESLESMAAGGTVAQGFHYLGRSGVCTIADLRVAYLSGIYAPRYIDTPREPPHTREQAKRAGYFRTPDFAPLQSVRHADIMLVHEWPRGIVQRAAAERRGISRPLRAYRFPWIGNPRTRELVNAIQPTWLFCGHSHVPFATVIRHRDGKITRVACLDQAARSDGAVLWMEWQKRRAVRAGWGISGVVSWNANERWTEANTPACGDETAQPAEGEPSAG